MKISVTLVPVALTTCGNVHKTNVHLTANLGVKTNLMKKYVPMEAVRVV